MSTPFWCLFKGLRGIIILRKLHSRHENVRSESLRTDEVFVDYNGSLNPKVFWFLNSSYNGFINRKLNLWIRLFLFGRPLSNKRLHVRSKSNIDEWLYRRTSNNNQTLPSVVPLVYFFLLHKISVVLVTNFIVFPYMRFCSFKKDTNND